MGFKKGSGFSRDAYGLRFYFEKGRLWPPFKWHGFFNFISKWGRFMFYFKKFALHFFLLRRVGPWLKKSRSSFSKKEAVFLTWGSAAIYKGLAVSISKRVGFDF